MLIPDNLLRSEWLYLSNPFTPIITADVDWLQDLPFSVQFDDIYYSAESGIEQSRHVFIDGNDLINRWKALHDEQKSLFTIAETGFGTGLNFLLTWHLWNQYAPKDAHLHYISCEKHPLSLDELQKSLLKWPELAEEATELLAHYPVLTPGYHQLSLARGCVSLTLMLGDALDCYEQLLECGEARLESELRTAFVDAWYLDGFTPRKNEEMWSESLLAIIAMLSRKNTTLATYTVAAPVKAALQHAGFVINKRKGFGSKRHMLIACFNQSTILKQKGRHTPWHIGYPQTRSCNSAIIIGAGLAGCFIAHTLAKRGWKITLIDEAQQVGSGASANQQAVLFPKLSAYKSPLTQFMLSSFLYATHFYKSILKSHPIGELSGSILLAHNKKELNAQESLKEWLSHYPELGVLVNAKQASELAGMQLNQPGLFIPLSGWLNSPELCRVLIDNELITLCTKEKADSLIYAEGQWVVNDKAASVVILANGNHVSDFPQTASLPVKSIRGQMSAIKATDSTCLLKIPLCADGHVLPAEQGVHAFGASFDLGSSSATISAEDDEHNYTKLLRIASECSWSKEIVNHWAGIRASTPDYLPLAGPVAIAKEFMTLYANLQTNSKRWIPQSGPYYPGLYVFAGFGSRGLTTIPLSAEWLASHINDEISCLPRNLVQALSPSRFLRKDIIRGLFLSDY